MTEKKIIVNIYKANIFSLVLFAAVAVVSAIIWFAAWQDSLHGIAKPIYQLIFFIALIAGILVHELIHGISWAFFCPNGWKDISFGIIMKMLTPYCHCKQPLPLKAYLLGALMPLIALGLVPWVIGLCVGSALLIIWGVVFISAAAGDILIAWKLRHETSAATIIDHPTEAGCSVYYEN